MTKNNCLFIGRTSSLPPEPEDKQHEIVYCLDNFDETDIDDIKLEYFVLVFLKTSQLLESDIEYIKAEWKELTQGDMSVKLIETKRSKLTKGFRKLLDTYDENEVIFKSPFVAFMQSSEKGYESALELVIRAAIKPAWKFWK